MLNKIKICFNTNLIELFYDEVYDFGSSTLLEYVYSYEKKIKQISFLDSDIDYKAYMKEETAFYKIKLFTINSNVEKIEDRYFEDNTTTNFLKIFDSKYSEDRLNIYENEYKELKRQYDVLDIIKGLKSYSLYFDLYDSNIIQNVCDNIIFNGKNIEELEITGINKTDSFCFVNSLKNMTNLKLLSISRMSDDKDLFNEISKITKENTLQTLSINVNHFKDAEILIKKHLLSLVSLTLKINNKKDNNLLIVKTLHCIENLRQLKLICIFPILDKNNINFFSLKRVTNLEISLYNKNNLFDLNYLFKNVPNLTKLHFNGIYFPKKKFINNSIPGNNIDTQHINKLRHLKFTHGAKNASLFILLILSKLPKKMNIKKLSVENCSFNNYIELNELLKSISLYSNLVSLSLNYLYFEKEMKNQRIIYEELQSLNQLEKFYYLGFKYDEWNIDIDSFISFINNNYLKLFEIGISCHHLNPARANSILFNLKNNKFLTKIKLFNHYSKDDILYDKDRQEQMNDEYKEKSISESYEQSESEYESDVSICSNIIDNYILIGKAIEYYLIDIRNISFYKCICYSLKIYQPKICFNDYSNIEYGKDLVSNNNEKEEFYLYQSIFSNTLTIMVDILCLNFINKNLSFLIKQRLEEIDEEEEDDSFPFCFNY